MIKRFFVIALTMALIIPVSSFAAGYYFTVKGTTGGRSTAIFGPFASLSDCQEAQAKALGRARGDQSISSCYAN